MNEFLKFMHFSRAETNIPNIRIFVRNETNEYSFGIEHSFESNIRFTTLLMDHILLFSLRDYTEYSNIHSKLPNEYSFE